MGRRSFTREGKLETARSVRERGVTISQASRDLGLSLGPPTRSFECRTDPQIFQNRAAPDDEDQPLQALCTQRQR